MIGMMGWSPALTSKPSLSSPARKNLVLRSSRSRSSVLPSRISSTAIDAPTIAGATVLENRYGRERWRSSATTSWRALVKPPDAPPSALPSVPVMMSTLPNTPRSSCVPRPRAPRKPVAWHSSMPSSAPCSSQIARISSSRAMVPSIENAPSVNTSMKRAPSARACASCTRRSSGSLCW
ncbi:hypothetical protein D9M68_834230 [compost metagenome]